MPNLSARASGWILNKKIFWLLLHTKSQKSK